jgi:DNA polymerase-3 subunit epsilon
VNLAKILTLNRACAVVDCESTGTDPQNDRICQIAITMHYPDREPTVWSSLVNCIIPIPAEATAVHHITNDMIKASPTFRTMAPRLAHALTNVDFAGFNVGFDLKLLQAEFTRADVKWSYEGTAIIDVKRIDQIQHPRKLSDVYEDYCGKPIDGAHDAGADVAATEEALVGQLTRHPEIPRDVKLLHEYCWPRAADAVDNQRKFFWRNGVACFSFGGNTGKPIHSVEKRYLKWMLSADFSPEVKRICEDALSGVYPQKGA